MPILIGQIGIDPDRMRTMEDAQRVEGSRPALITIFGDAEHYPEDVLTYLLVHALRPMVALGAKVERAHYRFDAKRPFPMHLLEGTPAACPYGSESGKPHQILASRAWPSTPDPELRSLDEPIVRWPVTAVLLSGGHGDYSAYIGMGSPAWVGKHGAKLSFSEASGVFPGLIDSRYAW